MDIYQWIATISEWMGVIAVAWLLSTSARFKKIAPVGFLYARRDGLMALFMSGLIVATAFIYYTANPAIIPAPIFGDTFKPAPAPVTDLLHSLIVAGLGLIPIVVAMWVRRQPIRSAGWHQTIMTAAALMGLAMAFITIILRNRFWTLLGGVSTAELFALLTAFGITLAEETVFRGYILLRLAWWLGEWPGLIATSLIYTLWHMPAWLSSQPPDTLLLLSALTFLQGMVLGWIMRKSHHVLAPAIYRAVSIWMRILS